MATYARIEQQGEAGWVEVEEACAWRLSAAPWAKPKRVSEALAWVSMGPSLPPVAPGKIVGVGKNYRAHAHEMGGQVPKEPLLFLKPSSSLLRHEGTLTLPEISQHVEFEAELGVVIGQTCRRVEADVALEYVLGYVPLCDVTARDLQKRDGQWARAKGCDGFCPVGPVLSTDIEDHANLSIQLWQNGELKQHGNTRDMVFDVPTLIAYISQAMTLEPGDLIATGTPAGVGPICPGDHIAVAVGNMPRLEFNAAR